MMRDALQLAGGEELGADVCIVGAGAAGIALALSLVDSGLDVLLLESGGLKHEPETQALYQGNVVDEHLHSPPDTYRQRRFGGSTTIWGGRCMPFDEIDFEARSYVPHSGWPITREDIEPFYPQANRLCEAGDFAYTAGTAFDRPVKPMMAGFTSPHFTADTLERFSCPTDFGRRYGAQLEAAKNVTLMLHANVTQLHVSPNGAHVETVSVRTLAGTGFRVRARYVVLATGGLEVPRLLLASRDVHAEGIGNEHGNVGRYYMCHIAGTIGDLVLAEGKRAWHGYDRAHDGVYCRQRLALTAPTQRERGLANFVARLHHPRITDPLHRTGILSMLYLAKAFIPYEYGKRLHGEAAFSLKTWLQHVSNVVLDPFRTATFLLHWLRYRTLASRKFPSIIVFPKAERYSLDFHAEQLPNPLSRVMLGSEVDALGMPKLLIDWRYTREDVDSALRTLKLLADDIAASGVGRFAYDPATVEEEMTRYGAYGGHHIGTTRMGSFARTSVVDEQCRVHGVANLFVASASVFPTSSQANPTLTIVAMALRLGAHLKARDRRVVPFGGDTRIEPASLAGAAS